jgi:uncharacterized NAD-dependent epimerase/dehydratase family protein
LIREGGTSKAKRIVILAEGLFSVLESKTASCVIRYRADEVVAVIDSAQAGRTSEEVLGFGGAIPVVASLDEALAYGPDTLLIGIAPRGGGLPDSWRPVLRSAMLNGLDVVSGLHFFVSDDPEFSALAQKKGVAIFDLRKVPDDIGISYCEAGKARGHVILTVGTDCNVGKMTATMELVVGARRAGVDAVMLSTGQTGIFLTESGIALDRCVADYIAGGAERLVLESDAPGRWLIMEGQGALTHPAYSGVALGILHGAMPSCLVLCHQPSRARMSGYDLKLPPLVEIIELHERLASHIKPCKVVAVALNTFDLDDAGAAEARERMERETGLPSADPVRHGAGPLVDAIRNHLGRRD